MVDLNHAQEIPDDAQVVVPSSNFIMHVNNDAFYQKYIDIMNQTHGLITFDGLGAQSTPLINTPKKLARVLTDTQVRMLKMISERAVTIGVRGPFTAECLDELGIHNHRVIGCPSLFKNLDGNCLEVTQPEKGNVQMTVTSGSIWKTKVLKFGMQHDCFWVKQSISEYPRVCMGGKMLSPKWLIRNFPGDLSVARNVEDYHKARSKTFFDIESWNQFYQQEHITFAFGTRFHGNMEALHNGVPALWITHDSRTRELTEFLHLPHMDERDFAKVKTMEELMDRCDYSELRANYVRMLDNYIAYLDENRIDHKFYKN